MRVHTLMSAVFVVLCVFVSSVYAASPVWKVSKGDAHLFIGGTIHLLSAADYPLPAGFEDAYRQADQLVFETDLQQMKNPEMQKQILAQVIYADGQSLQQVLNRQTFQTLEQYLASRRIPVANVVRFKPGMLALTLTVIELQRLGLGGTGVDEFYGLKASNDRKKMGQLETVEEQLSFLTTLGDGYENDMITYTLRDLKELPSMMQALKTAWRKGDNRGLDEVALAPFKKDFPAVYDKLIARRNRSWLPLIEAMLQTKDVEFVLVGALHLVGDDGLLAQLAARGYQVQMVD